jgi:hypothetical protein
MLPILSLRGMKPSSVAVMNDVLGSEIDRGESGARTDKRGLAAYYRVGLRCIEKWLYSGVIVGRMKGRKVEFDIADCDRRLLAHKD